MSTGKHSLRGDLTRAAMLTTLVALLLSAGSLLLFELRSSRDAFVSDLRTQADLLARSTAAALVFNDPKAAHENLALLRLKPSIDAAAIYDRRGAAFAVYLATPQQRPPPPMAASQSHQGSQFGLSQPITDGSEIVGTVVLQAHHDLAGRAVGYAAILVGVSLSSLLLSYFVFGRLQHKVTQPLLTMTAVAQEVMARRDWRLRAPASGNRDIAVLVQAFNGMLAEVEARTGELERSNAMLAQETAERREAENNLRLADRRKDEFLATLAHELRNPLAPMTNATALMRAPAATAAMREKAGAIIERQLRHMVRLIDDLLDVSRVTTGKLSLQLQRIDLAAVLEAAVEVAEPAVAARGQQLTLSGAQSPCWLFGDAARLTQVLANLLSNACRYTEAGGRITLSLRRLGGWAEVEVADTGAGIEPAMQQRIFELFEQADKSLERGNTGLGIGLTLARQLARLHGGDITVHSEGLGRGSRFTLRLPVAADAAREAPAPHVPAIASAPRGLKVLVADDNRDHAGSLAELLQSEGHQVVVAHDGRAALQAARDAQPDVAVLDIGMPGLNGYDVARLLRADPDTAAIALVAVTGWGQASDKALAAAAGFDRHLVKPVSFEALLQALRPSA